MSYDIDLVVNHDDGYSTTVFDSNITYNLRPMLVAAGLPDSLWSLNGLTAIEAQPLIFSAWRGLRTRPDYYSQFDASNGWGTHADLVPWIRDLYLKCRLHPRAVISVR